MYERITKYAGWFLSTIGTWHRHFYGEHYVLAEDWVDGVPHYQMRGALQGFACEASSDWPLSRYVAEPDFAQKELTRRGVVIEDDADALARIDVSFLDAPCVLAIIGTCVGGDRHGEGLLRTAAASSLLDRCLLKLADIDLMDRSCYAPQQPQAPESSHEGAWSDYDKDHLPEWVWCIVGNVVDEHPFGPDHVIVHGTKHFSPGTKVYCFPSQWGDGYDHIVVIGRQRGSRNLLKIVTRRNLIENFRCQKVYAPAIIKRMFSGDRYEGWGNSEADHMKILTMLQWLNRSSNEVEKRDTVRAAQRLTFSSRLDGVPESAVCLKVERRTRGDGCFGAGWYGSYTIGGGEELALGLIDWCGYWPDGATYEECAGDYRSDSAFVEGLIEAGVHLWDESYCAEPRAGVPSYSWEFEAVAGQGSVRSAGRNDHPVNYPAVLHYLEAWGFPKVWDAGRGAPDAVLR